MIVHVALYAFRPETTDNQIEASIRKLQEASHKTGLVRWFLSGQHMPIAADAALPDQVYDFALLWGFANRQDLEEFSSHPVLTRCITETLQPVLEKLAVVTLCDVNEVCWQDAETEDTCG